MWQRSEVNYPEPIAASAISLSRSANADYSFAESLEGKLDFLRANRFCFKLKVRIVTSEEFFFDKYSMLYYHHPTRTDIAEGRRMTCRIFYAFKRRLSEDTSAPFANKEQSVPHDSGVAPIGGVHLLLFQAMGNMQHSTVQQAWRPRPLTCR